MLGHEGAGIVEAVGANVTDVRPGARFRALVHRGAATTAMIYDGLAIIDTFKRIDDDTVLGVMDMRAMPLPYFFVLRRAG